MNNQRWSARLPPHYRRCHTRLRITLFSWTL